MFDMMCHSQPVNQSTSHKSCFTIITTIHYFFTKGLEVSPIGSTYIFCQAEDSKVGNVEMEKVDLKVPGSGLITKHACNISLSSEI